MSPSSKTQAGYVIPVREYIDVPQRKSVVKHNRNLSSATFATINTSSNYDNSVLTNIRVNNISTKHTRKEQKFIDQDIHNSKIYSIHSKLTGKMDNVTRISQRIKSLRSQNVPKKRKKSSHSKLVIKNSFMKPEKKTSEFICQTDFTDSNRLVLMSSNPSMFKIPDPIAYYGESQAYNSDSEYEPEIVKNPSHKRSISLKQNAPIEHKIHIRKES